MYKELVMTDSINTKEHTDIKKLAWIERFFSPFARPYLYAMRLDRPIGIWLLLIPSLWSIALAAGGISNMGAHEYYVVALFAIGSVIMRGAGCIINDLWDHGIDQKVERTKLRPIASGALGKKQAFIFLATLLLTGLIILLQFNIITIILGFLTLPLIIAYPLMKRITWWPQAFLGITFNFGALMGCSAISGEVSMAAIGLYIAGFFWTLAYDTIYAHQDKEDDMRIGIKSTALHFGEHSKLWVSGFFALTFAFLCLGLWASTGAPSLSHVPIIIVALNFVWQIKSWNTSSKESSLKIFKANHITGLLVLLACF